VTPTQFRRIRTRLTTFAEDLFQSFPARISAAGATAG
jgi:hypothetical protein